jgi:hypothetical protein
MALLIRGKNKGREVTIHQWCNDWFSISMDNKASIVSPLSLQLTINEIEEVLSCTSNGLLFNLFKLDIQKGTFLKL